jgi:hypothetical protein
MPRPVYRSGAAEEPRCVAALPWQSVDRRTKVVHAGALRSDIRSEGGWRLARRQLRREAQLRHCDDIKRCSASHGRVILLGTYGALWRLALARRRGHDGCPFRPLHYQEVATRHPEAVQ